MYNFIRLLIVLPILVLLLLLIRKRKKMGRIFSIAMILALIVGIYILFIPFENAFLTFSAPEEAYRYYGYSEDVKLIIEGQHSDLLVGDKNGTHIQLIVPKTDDGWKVGTAIDSKEIAFGSNNDAIVSINQYKDTGEYYIAIYMVKDEASQITDTLNTQFVSYGRGYYAYIPEYNEKYHLVVNGKEIQWSEK